MIEIATFVALSVALKPPEMPIRKCMGLPASNGLPLPIAIRAFTRAIDAGVIATPRNERPLARLAYSGDARAALVLRTFIATSAAVPVS